MEKYKYRFEFEFNASAKLLFTYLTTPAGIKQWFADDVKQHSERKFTFIFEKKEYEAEMTVYKLNYQVRYEFEPMPNENKKDLSYIDFKLETNEMTNTVFLTVTDYSEIDSGEEDHNLWQNLIGNLRSIVGG